MNVPIEVALGDGDVPRWITMHVKAGMDQDALARKCALILGVDPEEFSKVVRADRQNAAVGSQQIAVGTFVQPLAKFLLVRRHLEGPRSLTVLAFGDDSSGQLGRRARPVAYHLPKPLSGLLGRRVVGISAGSAHSAFILESGSLLTCGDGSLGRLGLGESFAKEKDNIQRVPRRVEFPQQRCHIVQVQCAGARTFCLNSRGQVFAFGERGACLGIENLETDIYSPLEVNDLHSITTLSASQIRVLACGFDGTVVYAWGSEPDGERARPTRIDLEHRVVELAAGKEISHYSLLAMSDGSFFELAPGKEQIPYRIPKVKRLQWRAHSITTGNQLSVIVGDDGDAFCVPAKDSFAQTEDWCKINIKRGGSIRKVFGGLNNIVFICEGGRPFGLGNSSCGQLTVRSTDVPEPIWLGNGLDCVESVAIGDRHTLLNYASYVSPLIESAEDDNDDTGTLPSATNDLFQQTRESCAGIGTETCVVS